MRTKRTLILGFLLGSIIIFFGCNGIENELFLMRNKKMVSGKIIDVFPSSEVKSYSRRIKYVYSVNDKDYVDFKKLDTQDEKQAIGNELTISYSVKNPKRNKVEILLNTFKNSDTKKYYSKTDKGYIEICLINGVFKYKEFAERGKLINNIVGDYSIIKDSIKFNHYHFNQDIKEIQEPLILVNDPDIYRQLIDIQTKRVYKKI